MKGSPDVVKWRAVSMFKMLNSPPEVSMFKIKKIVIIIKYRYNNTVSYTYKKQQKAQFQAAEGPIS